MFVKFRVRGGDAPDGVATSDEDGEKMGAEFGPAALPFVR